MTTELSKLSEARRLVTPIYRQGDPNRDIPARLNLWSGTHSVDAGLPKVAQFY